MSWEARRPVDGLVGSLSTGCTALDTQISAAVFANLPSTYTQSTYLPLVLANDQTGTFEIVFGYAHTANSTSLSVSRGMEGTTAQPWPAGTTVRCAPTLYDGTQAMTFSQANALTDAYVGMRVIDPNMLALLEKSRQGPFYQSVRVPGNGMGISVEGNITPPSGASMLVQAGHCNATTYTNGFINWTLPYGAFPNGIAAVFTTKYLTGSDASFAGGADCNGSLNNGTQISFACKGFSNTLLPGGTYVNFSILVIGW